MVAPGCSGLPRIIEYTAAIRVLLLFAVIRFVATPPYGYPIIADRKQKIIVQVVTHSPEKHSRAKIVWRVRRTQSRWQIQREKGVSPPSVPR